MVLALALVVSICGFVNSSIDPFGIVRIFTGPAVQPNATEAASVEKVEPYLLSIDSEGFGSRG